MMFWALPMSAALSHLPADSTESNQQIGGILTAGCWDTQIVEQHDASHGTFLLPQCGAYRRKILQGMRSIQPQPGRLGSTNKQCQAGLSVADCNSQPATELQAPLHCT